MGVKLYICCQCKRRFTERPKAVLDYWVWYGFFENEEFHPKDLVRPNLGKIFKAKVVCCSNCI